MKKDKDKTKKNTQLRADMEDIEVPRKRSDSDTVYYDAEETEETVPQTTIPPTTPTPSSSITDIENEINEFKKQEQIDQIENIKKYLNNIGNDDVKSLIQYIVMNNSKLTLPIKIQIILENESYFCIIDDSNNIATFKGDSKVDNGSTYTLQITCNIDTALNLILDIYNSTNKPGMFVYNYTKLNPLSDYIPDCFKLYKNGAEISILNCAKKQYC